jgi:hypothetical protein
MTLTNAPAPPIALVISDIDGTLITSNHELTAATHAAAVALRESGIALSLASSRPPRSIRPLAEALGLRAPFAAFNGALMTTAEGEVVARSSLPVTTMTRIKAIADECDLSVWIYDEREWCAPARDAFVEREEHTSGFSAKLTDYAARLAAPANKLTVVGKPEFVAEAERRVLATLGPEVSASRSKPRFLDVTACGIHKGTVVARLSELLGISRAAIAVIGDGPNDVEMFNQAAVSIAMGQAVDEVRAAARHLTASNDDEGWARGIERFVLRRK